MILTEGRKDHEVLRSLRYKQSGGLLASFKLTPVLTCGLERLGNSPLRGPRRWRLGHPRRWEWQWTGPGSQGLAEA